MPARVILLGAITAFDSGAVIALFYSTIHYPPSMRPIETWVTYMTDQLWNPSLTHNVVDETRAELVDNLTRYALTF